MKEWDIRKLALALGSLMEIVSVKTGSLSPQDIKRLKKQYGFQLEPNPNTGFYDIRYKDLETGKRLGMRVSSYCSTEIEAISFAIDNREDTIRRYRERKAKRQELASGLAFYDMLTTYYKEESPYLKDDRANGRRDVPPNQLINHNGFIRKHLIPYLKEREIKTIKEVSPDVYSGLKTYLMETARTKSGKTLQEKTINNYLDAFNRILKYHERKEIITLPYKPGNGVINKAIQGNRFAEKKILPTEYLQGIFRDEMGECDPLPLLTAKIALATGMRESEMEKVKRSDIHRIEGIEDAYYIEAQNHKIRHFAKRGGDLYRKIPIHPYIFRMLWKYIAENGIGKQDYVFTKHPGLDAKTGKIHAKELYKYRRGLFELNQLILIRKGLATGDTALFRKAEKKNVKNVLKEAGISPHSIRHTYETLLTLMFPGQTLLIDYFMGHKPAQAMLANYQHINQVDEITWWNQYGKHLVEYQKQFVPDKQKIKQMDSVIANALRVDNLEGMEGLEITVIAKT